MGKGVFGTWVWVSMFSTHVSLCQCQHVGCRWAAGLCLVGEVLTHVILEVTKDSKLLRYECLHSPKIHPLKPTVIVLWVELLGGD